MPVQLARRELPDLTADDERLALIVAALRGIVDGADQAAATTTQDGQQQLTPAGVDAVNGK